MKRIAIFSNGKAALPTLSFLKRKKYPLLVITDPEDDGKDSWQKSLKRYCQENNILFVKPKKINSLELINDLKKFSPDIMFSIQCRRIIKKYIIQLVNGEVFNFHFSDLPKNRGCYPGIWHLLNTDSHVGVTLHKLTEGIDAGDILDKTRKKITTSDTGRSVYDWCCKEVLPLLKKNLEQILEKTYTVTKQNESYANYYSRTSLDFQNLFVDWNKSPQTVSRFIQAYSFPPFQFAMTNYMGKYVTIQSVIKTNKSTSLCIPGTIVKVLKNRVTVKVKNGSVTVTLNTKGLKLQKYQLFYL